MSKHMKLGAISIGLIIAAILPFLLSSGYHLRLANLVGIYLLLVLGLNFVLGYAGLLSFAQVGFFAIGAYTSAILTTDYGYSFWFGLCAGAVAAGISALIVGSPVLKLRGHYFAFATFVLGEIARLVAMNWDEVTHGASGLSSIPAPAIGDFQFDTDLSFYYIVLAFVLLGIIVSARVENSKIGRALFAIRESEIAAEAMGIRTRNTKQLAFTLSAVFAGVAGALYGPLNTVISPDVFSFDISIIVLVSLLLGGTGTIPGAIIGTILVTLLPEWLRFLDQYYMMIYGAGIVLLMVFLPQGLMGVVYSLRIRRAKTRSNIHNSSIKAPARTGDRQGA
jgi:branched-chain amino acid transport system permease protein